MTTPNILVIEDDPEDQQCLCSALSSQGYQVTTIADPDQAFATVRDWARQFQLVIIEEAMRGGCGLQLLHEARRQRDNLPVVMVTRDADWRGYASAMSEGAAGYIPCPTDRFQLLASVRGALESEESEGS